MLIVKNEVDLKTSNSPVKYEILIKQCLHLILSKNGNYITQQSFIRGSSAQKFSPLTSYILPFWTEKVPLLYTFYIDKWYPFHKLVKNMESLLLAVNAPSFNYK